MIRDRSLLPRGRAARLDAPPLNIMGPVTRPVEEVLRRFEKAKADKLPFVSYIMEIFDYFMPNRSNTYGESPPTRENAGRRTTDKMLDSTPQTAATRLVSRLHSVLVPAFRKWLMLEAGYDVPSEERNQVEQALEEQTDILFEFIDASNFHTAIDSEFYDFIAGTGTLRLQDGTLEQPLDFSAVSIANIVPEEGPNGVVITAFLERNVKGRDIKILWPRAEMSQLVADMIERDGDKEFCIVEAEIHDHNTNTWEYHVIMSKDKERIFTDRYELPVLYVHRWAALVGENMGRGPCMDALPSARTLNAIKEFTLKAAQKAIAPPIVSGQFGLINPGAFASNPNAVNIAEDSSDVRPLNTGARIDFGQVLVEDERGQIRDSMFVSKFTPAEGPVRTATEWQLALKELMDAIGGAFPRFYAEFLFRIIRKATDILVRRGKMAPIRVDGRDVTIRFVGPLAQVQDQDDVLAFERYWQVVSNMGIEVAMLGTVVEDVPEWVADKVGLPTSLTRSEEDREKLQQLVGQIVAASQAEAQAGSSGGPVPPDGSPVSPSGLPA